MPVFPFHSYSLKSIIEEKEITIIDVENYNQILLDLSSHVDDDRKIDFDIINTVCNNNNMIFKRFLYIESKLPFCFLVPYADFVYEDLVLSCSEDEIALFHNNRYIRDSKKYFRDKYYKSIKNPPK